MNQKCFTIGVITFFLLYYSTIVLVQVDTKTMYTGLFGTTCDILRSVADPEFAVAIRKEQSPFTFRTTKITLDSCSYGFRATEKWNIKYRPLVGDHIHIGIAIMLDGHLITLHDRNMTEPVPYEDFHPINTCIDPPKYAYVKKWYHTGVHTHCDNIIHVHPWSAPRQLRVEGKAVTLKMWFESVGIEVGSVDNVLRIPGNPYYDDWQLEYYVHVNDEYPSLVTSSVEEMKNLWLVDHHAFVKLYRKDEDKPPKDFRVLDYYSKSKIGKYPKRYN